MFRAAILCGLLIATFFGTAYAEELNQELSVKKRPKHHVVYVHGFGGDYESFGAMPWYLVGELQRQQPEYKFHSHYFHYGNIYRDKKLEIDNLQDMGVKENIAKFLGEFINEKVNKKQSLQPEDRISIIAHSQGGLISTIWIYNAALTGQPKYNPQLTNNIYSFITIGTPFWGSKIATLWAEPTRHPGKLLLKGAMALTLDKNEKRQLTDMGFASNSQREFRKNLTLIPVDKINALKERIRFLNISGVARYNELEEKVLQTFGGKYAHETDLAVSLPSSQINTISLTDFESDYPAGYKSAIGKATIRHLADTYVSTGYHSLFKKSLKAIASLPAACKDINAEACDHDIYKVIVGYLQGKEVGINKDFEPHHSDIDMQLLLGFTVELIVKLPNDLTRKEVKRIKKTITATPVMQVSEERQNKDPKATNYGKVGRIIVNRYWEPMSMVKIYRPADDIMPFNSLHIRMTGSFDLDVEQDQKLLQGLKAWGDTLTFEIGGNGYKSRVIEFPIKPTYSVDLMLNLERDPNGPVKQKWTRRRY